MQNSHIIPIRKLYKTNGYLKQIQKRSQSDYTDLRSIGFQNFYTHKFHVIVLKSHLFTNNVEALNNTCLLMWLNTKILVL